LTGLVAANQQDNDNALTSSEVEAIATTNVNPHFGNTIAD